MTLLLWPIAITIIYIYIYIYIRINRKLWRKNSFSIIHVCLFFCGIKSENRKWGIVKNATTNSSHLMLFLVLSAQINTWYHHICNSNMILIIRSLIIISNSIFLKYLLIYFSREWLFLHCFSIFGSNIDSRFAHVIRASPPITQSCRPLLYTDCLTHNKSHCTAFLLYVWQQSHHSNTFLEISYAFWSGN